MSLAPCDSSIKGNGMRAISDDNAGETDLSEFVESVHDWFRCNAIAIDVERLGLIPDRSSVPTKQRPCLRGVQTALLEINLRQS